ncbi:hypothetical protein CASFOL_016225 [Castilleja foliolosa]|uniref:Filament-like plant protein n=1 Tax=Castilleja foliolosa TaxID=1961234 RepID=A0ABD3DHX2_9LAMI
MEKKKWLWKRKSSEKSLGKIESSISYTSHSERYSDKQYTSRESTNDYDNTKSAESVKILTEKLSAALVNVSSKEELVKQHAKVAEEAIAGWEKSENEVGSLKNALKECVRQLSQKQDEHEKKISDAIIDKTKELELTNSELKKENSFLKQELKSKCADLETLSTESVKKIAKLEAECKKLQSFTDSRSELSCSGSWGPSLSPELDQFKTEKPVSKNLVDIDLMDDFLEMERIASLSETKTDCIMNNLSTTEIDLLKRKVIELENKSEKIEAEKVEVEIALDESRCCLEEAERKIVEVENKLDELQREMNANSDKMRGEIEKERKLSGELTVRCRELEYELKMKVEGSVIQQKCISPNGEVKLKQEELVVAADKLAECQKTIASLGKQLKSLATLEDFLIDTSTVPRFSKGPSNDMFCNLVPQSLSNYLENGKCEEPQPHSSLHPLSDIRVVTTASKSRSGFGKLFSRIKSTRKLDNPDLITNGKFNCF